MLVTFASTGLFDITVNFNIVLYKDCEQYFLLNFIISIMIKIIVMMMIIIIAIT